MGGDGPRRSETAAISERAARDEFERLHPPLRALVVSEDLRTVEPIDRPCRNDRGRWFELSDDRVLSTEAYSCIVAGHGDSLADHEDQPVGRFEWSEGTLFSPPVHAWHQHSDRDPERPARHLAIHDTGLVRHCALHEIERHPWQDRDAADPAPIDPGAAGEASVEP